MDFANYWSSAIATADLGETIEQSLRFRGGISGSGNGGMLSKTITTSSTTAALTISFWVKLGNIPSGYNRFIFSSGTAGTASGNINYVNSTDEGIIKFQDTSSYTAFETQKLRDPSAWYHIVYRFDAANQYVKVYVNGSEHSSTSIATSARTSFGATSPMQIGRYADSSYANSYWDGYLAEWNMLFGTSLGPDSFGRTNDDGVWVPKDLSDLTSNQYGALGHRLVFNSSAGLGDDTAPTGGTHASANDFTASGFDTGDVALWSAQLYTSTNSSLDVNSTDKNFHASGPATASFDGSTSSGSFPSGSDTALVFRPDSAITGVTSLRIYSAGNMGSGSFAGYNGTNIITNPTNGWHSLYSGSATTVNNVYITSTGSASFAAIEVNGTILTDNTDNDVDFNDTPTNNHATLLPLLARSSSITFEQANLRSQFGGGGSHSGMAGFGIVANSGKYYWEVIIKEQMEGTLGIVSDDFDLEAGVLDFSDDAAGWGWKLGQAVRENNGTEVSSSHSITVVDDVIGFLLDTTAGTCTIEINGVAQTSGNGAEYTNIPTNKTIYPYFRIGGASGDANFDFNFGQMPFLHEPSGYQHVATNSLTEPTIKNGKDHFDVRIWEGDLLSKDITGLNFQPDFVWIKCRDTTFNHNLVDSVRGTDKILYADVEAASGNAEVTSSNLVTSFNSDGFSVSNNASSNNTGNDYVAWCWKAGGTAVSNTDGTITSSVSANTDAGFSIVSYTGTGSNATVGHGLTTAPDVVVVKGRDFSDEWHVKHPGLSSNNHSIRFNSDASEADFSVWQNSAPTDSVFYIGSQNGVNQNTKKFIAYCWHSVEGYSKFGSYNGAGPGSGAPNLDGAYIYTGFRPAFLLVKRINASGDPWILLDSTRDTTNFAFKGLQPNTTAAEPSSGDSYACDFLSNGFKWRTANAGVNNSTATYVYFCFAENPFGGENQPPATAR